MDKKRGEVGSQVSSWFPSTNKFTSKGFTSSILPYGLQLRQTISSGTTVTLPAGLTFVYAILAGPGATGGTFNGGGGAGQLTWGWTFADTTCLIGAVGNNNYTRYGHLFAGTGGNGTSATLFAGAGGGGGTSGTSVGQAGKVNFWGMPAGNLGVAAPAQGASAAQGTGGSPWTTAGISVGGAGGDGISGGGGGANSSTTNTSAQTGGAGGNGIIGGGGGAVTASTGSRIGGAGGNGFNIFTGAIRTGGSGSTGTGANGSGGGGAGIAGNGSNAVTTTGGAGGLGGGGGGGGSTTGGAGGAGILYLFY